MHAARESRSARGRHLCAARTLFFLKKKVSCLPPIKLIINFINVFFACLDIISGFKFFIFYLKVYNLLLNVN